MTSTNDANILNNKDNSYFNNPDNIEENKDYSDNININEGKYLL
jgi:hypothetical protein